jgi:hypothetical protein
MMNQPIFKRVFPQVLAWAGLVALSSVIALAQGIAPPPDPTDAARTDGQIEMDVVHALDATKELKDDLITAATIQSEVMLSGTVSTEASRQLAESIASHVSGVTKVTNNLKIGNPQNAPTEQQVANAGDQQPADGQQAGDQDEMRAQIRAEVQSQIQAQRQAQGQGPSSPVPPPPPAYQAPTGPVTIPQGTLLQLRTSEPVGSKRAKNGQPVQFMVIHDVAIGGVLAIPRGATVLGVVTEARRAGALSGSPELALRLTSLELGGQSYSLDTDQFKVKGPDKTGRTVSNAIGGALMGALIGGAADRGFGAAVGAGAGAAAGTAASAASPGPGVWIPSEARVDFHLMTPVTVTPVSAQEATRLAQGLYPGGPKLYRRGYGQPYLYYPPVYYRPYYAVGGYYYWR